jgi:hypothetical protein
MLRTAGAPVSNRWNKARKGAEKERRRKEPLETPDRWVMGIRSENGIAWEIQIGEWGGETRSPSNLVGPVATHWLLEIYRRCDQPINPWLIERIGRSLSTRFLAGLPEIPFLPPFRPES